MVCVISSPSSQGRSTASARPLPVSLKASASLRFVSSCPSLKFRACPRPTAEPGPTESEPLALNRRLQFRPLQADPPRPRRTREVLFHGASRQPVRHTLSLILRSPHGRSPSRQLEKAGDPRRPVRVGWEPAALRRLRDLLLQPARIIGKAFAIFGVVDLVGTWHRRRLEADLRRRDRALYLFPLEHGVSPP